MTRLYKLQLAARNRIANITMGSSRLSVAASSIAAGVLTLFPMGSLGHALASVVSELTVNVRTEGDGTVVRPSHISFVQADLSDFPGIRRGEPTAWKLCGSKLRAISGGKS